jgi:nucleotide-binding universal stress UspA family protein
MTKDHPVVLLTTDFSPAAAQAYGPCVAFAQRLGARIVLAHVVEVAVVAPHGAPLAPAQLPPDTTRVVERARADIEEAATALGPDIVVETALEVSADVPDAILRMAKEHKADLIALSTHGRTGLRRLVLGSVAETVVRRAPLPVLTFPPGP